MRFRKRSQIMGGKKRKKREREREREKGRKKKKKEPIRAAFLEQSYTKRGTLERMR